MLLEVTHYSTYCCPRILSYVIKRSNANNAQTAPGQHGQVHLLKIVPAVG